MLTEVVTQRGLDAASAVVYILYTAEELAGDRSPTSPGWHIASQVLQ